MKKVVLLLTILSLTGCKKEKKVCWKCAFGQSVNGAQRAPETVCNDGEIPTFTDPAGNDLNSFCEKQ